MEAENLKIYRKYKSITNFSDQPAKVYNGPLAEPDFSSNPDAVRFKSRIKEACAKSINFAGKYTLAIWGCGTACQMGMVVDRETGKIYKGFQSELGSEFRKDSKLLIKNAAAIDIETNLIKLCPYCEVKHLLWTGENFEELE